MSLALLLIVMTGPAAAVWGQPAGQAPVPVASSAVLVRTGEHTVTVGEMRALMAAQPSELRQQMLTNPKQLGEIVRSEVERKAVAAEARRLGVDRQPDVLFRTKRAQEQAILDAYLAQFRVLPEGYPFEAEVIEYYTKNKARFLIAEQISLSTLFVVFLPAWAGDREIERKVRAEAATLSARARGGADFGELARLHSQDRPTAERGGLVGWVTREQLLPELAQIAFALNTGEVSDPIRTQFGFHVIRVNDRKPAVQRELSDVRGEVTGLLQQEYRIRKEREAIDTALRKRPISVDAALLERWRLEDLKPEGPR